MRPIRSDRQTLLPIWQTGAHGRRPRPGAHRGRTPAARAAPAARDHAGRPLGGDRHLGEHPVPAGVRCPPADPRAAAPAGQGARRHARRARRRPAHRRPAHPPAPGHPPRHDHGAPDPPRRRHPGVQAGDPGREPPAGTRSADPRGLRMALRPQRAAAARPRRARPRALAGRGGRVRHPRAALVRRRRPPSRSSSSACSAGRANAHTCAPAPRRCRNDATRSALVQDELPLLEGVPG